MTELPVGPPPAAPMQPDDWPHTRRILPWLIALFMALIFLVPFDSTVLPVNLPFDLELDRIAVGVMGLVWLAVVLAGKPGAPRFHRSPVNLALGALVLVAVTSVLVNMQSLANAVELSLALKKLVLLGAFLAFFFIVASAVRPGEVRAFATLLLGLATVSAIGVIYEYRTGTNVFFDVTDMLPGTKVYTDESSSTFDASGRRGITGPTAHGLAATTILAMAVPLALLGVMRARELRSKLFYAAITAILLSGSISTVRKSAAIVPAVGFLVLAIYRPRAMVRLSPLLAVLVVVVHFMAPGAMGSIKKQFFPEGGFYNSPSVQGRTEDFANIKPDLKHSPIIGKGYGTYDPDTYRTLDNQYLGLRITTGWLGYAAYLLLLFAVALVAHRVVRTRDPSRAPPALAALAAAAAVGVASKLFDAFAFPQVPYTFLFLAALAVALAAEHPRQLRAKIPRAPQAPRSRPVPSAAGALAGTREG